MVFENYANLYDLFYAEKHYFEENDYILALLNQSGEKIKSILDLGCGTGGHVLPLTEKGYEVTGVDFSLKMVDQAIEKSKDNTLATFVHGDIRDIRLGRKFDAVVSMFAVMGYQITNKDMFDAFLTAREHMNIGGYFIFDAWYGPAVLRELPETRVREFDLGSQKIIRMAMPELNHLENSVVVNYKILRLEGERVLEEINESHPMRYLFAPEIEMFAEKSGFELVAIYPFMENARKPEITDWNVTWVLKAI